MIRYIDVISAAATTRSIASYESTLDLRVTSNRRTSCFDASLKLRDAVIAALKDAGFTDSEVNEGGGDVAQNWWSSGKSVSHRIIVRNSDMAVLMNGMAAVERILAENGSTIFSPIKQTFTFGTPTPIYAPSVSAADAIDSAMKRARVTADAIAAAHGTEIDSVMCVFEISTASQQSSNGHDELHDSSIYQSDFCEIQDSFGASPYSALEAPSGRGTRRFRVRFLLKPSHGQESAPQVT
jgi:hypothetical protein